MTTDGIYVEIYPVPITVVQVRVSGDLTFEASKEEYASALEFVNFMRSTYNLNDNCYSICPGNHDLKFSEKPYAEDDKVTIAYDSSKEAYIDFYRQVFGADPTESLYSIRRFLTPDLVPIEVIAINSCLLQQDKDHFRGMGYVGNDQRNEIGLSKNSCTLLPCCPIPSIGKC